MTEEEKAMAAAEAAAELEEELKTEEAAEEQPGANDGLSEEKPEATKQGEVLDTETLFLAGYLYRHWHFYTGESSKDIYKQAPITIMKQVYLPYHSMSIEMAIDRLKETYTNKKAKKN